MRAFQPARFFSRKAFSWPRGSYLFDNVAITEISADDYEKLRHTPAEGGRPE